MCHSSFKQRDSQIKQFIERISPSVFVRMHETNSLLWLLLHTPRDQEDKIKSIVMDGRSHPLVYEGHKGDLPSSIQTQFINNSQQRHIFQQLKLRNAPGVK
ncbi:hypothetical protein TNCV_1938421 [Trichonephila clavipes]|nr:hypothetical protein TNCV_1938421 [Trichonephila clavipes]